MHQQQVSTAATSPLQTWMASRSRTPISVAFEAGVSLATVERARRGRRVSFEVARRLVVVSGGELSLEALLAGVSPAPLQASGE